MAAGEDLAVDVTFTNPLALKLKLSDVRLVYEFQPDKPREAGEAPADGAAAGGDSMVASSDGMGSGGGVAQGAAPVQATPAQFSLHPSEVLSERLTLRPLAPGWLRVTGVSWVLEGGVEGRAAFEIKGRHRKRPKGDRWADFKGDGLTSLRLCELQHVWHPGPLK